ncbi:YaaR family protein [Thermohalobacter berrensis]|uniref:DUF327 domain-containing protein n=1 Tax=Thermohalobacter berrensis TaxID=99594 RepID=A0A419SUG9_9FIRM|nr:YaaR family protein [Thermohalobacter berrensis]RKD28828.1 hypothetical protein BET03_07300 [Thermohalobacter berrensis]
MKISDILKKPSGKINIDFNENKNRNNIKGNSFKEELEKIAGLNIKERLGILLQKIDRQAERLSKNVNIKELIAYKKLVSEFLRESVNSTVKFSKNSFLDKRGRHRIYAIIKKVDDELEELTEEVLKKEKDNIKVLKKLDDIRGLILDIYM